MSAAGRNLAGNERRADDFYATPAWCTWAILSHLLPCSRVFDPCAGEGAILNAIQNVSPSTIRMGYELDHLRAFVAGVGEVDALIATWPACDLVLTNPPYSLALEFIERAAEQCPTATRAFLLRLNFLGSQKRAAFLRANPPDVYVLPRRPSFTGKGTDATEYAWMVWGPGRGGRWQILEVE